PYEMHQLTANAFLSQMIEELSEEHKEILYFLSIRLYSTTQLAQLRGQSDRNIRKVRNTIRKKLQKRLYAHLCQMQDEGKSLTLRERQFMEEYACGRCQAAAAVQALSESIHIQPRQRRFLQRTVQEPV